MMKNNKILLIIFICFSLSEILTGQEIKISGDKFIDYGSCNFTVEEVKVVDKIRDSRKTIKPHDRKYKLLIVCLKGKSPQDGILVFNPTIFSIIAEDEGEPFLVSSRGFGQEYMSESGEKKEFWSFSENNAIVTGYLEMKKDQNFSVNVVFDLPEAVEFFRIQIPSVSSQGRISVSNK